MTHAARLAREDALTEALRIADLAIGNEPPTDQALRIIAAIKSMRAGRPARVASLTPVDYLERVQTAARGLWAKKHANDGIGSAMDATASVSTPIGELTITTWRTRWSTRQGERIAWSSEYSLDGEPITLAEIKAAGLAARPTTRNRRKR